MWRTAVGKTGLIQVYDLRFRKRGGCSVLAAAVWGLEQRKLSMEKAGGTRSGGVRSQVWGFTGRVRGLQCLFTVEWHFHQCGQEGEEMGTVAF